MCLDSFSSRKSHRSIDDTSMKTLLRNFGHRARVTGDSITVTLSRLLIVNLRLFFSFDGEHEDGPRLETNMAT